MTDNIAQTNPANIFFEIQKNEKEVGRRVERGSSPDKLSSTSDIVEVHTPKMIGIKEKTTSDE